MRDVMMSGHCLTPSTTDGTSSHDRCHRMGGGNRANPRKEFSPCPCPCHYPEERFECGNCGGTLAEAPLWPQEDGTDDPVYTHIDAKTGRATGEECSAVKVSRNEPETKPVIEVDDDECPKCFARLGSPLHYEVCGDDEDASVMDDPLDEEDELLDMLADLMEDA